MSWRTYLVLGFIGLIFSALVAQLQPFPGYLDSDYYFAGGLQLVRGEGFTEPYLWNYLDDPQALPHPSHAYWMPLPSLITAAGLRIFGRESYAAGRAGFLLIAALVPMVTAALAFSFSRRGELAIVSALLAIFSIFHAPFLPVPDNFGPYMLMGGLYLLIAARRGPGSYFGLGLLSGLLMLGRADGAIWLGLTGVLVLWRYVEDRDLRFASRDLLLSLAGFLLVMGPWFWRNSGVFGTPLAPGGQYLLWLRSYDETFLFPASQLTMARWLAQGWPAIAESRLDAAVLNLENAWAAQGGVFLFPFILLGGWQNRKDLRVRMGALAWLLLLLVMTLVFPFAGKRGGFFHAGAALQPLWWTLAVLGLESAVAAARRRNWFTPAAFKVFRTGFVALALLMTAVILYVRIVQSGWGEGEERYPQIEAFLQQSGIQPGETVIVRNPPGYYLMTGRPAVVIPYGDESAVLQVAARFHARFLIVEAAGAAGPIRIIYENLTGHVLQYLGEVDGTRIFEIGP